MTVVSRQTRQALADIAAGGGDALESPRDDEVAQPGLDARTYGLVRIAVLIALDAPPASYARHVADAIDGGATADDLLGVLRAVAPQVGGPRVVAAAPEIMLVLGVPLPEIKA